MYDAWQVTFYLSNLASTSVGPVSEPLDQGLPFLQALARAQAAAQAYLTGLFAKNVSTTLADPASQEKIGNDWTIVWGPATVVIGPDKIDQKGGSATFSATNSAYVVRSQRENRYVLAIAGTNPFSGYDWIVEDVFIAPGVTWESALQTWSKSGSPVVPTSTSTPNLTSGTFVGVTNVLGLQDPATQATLQSFLGSLRLDASTTLTVTGHSLGGALAPTLALALIDPQAPLSSLARSQVRAYPTAGPTPGNVAFAEHYFEYLPASVGTQNWQIWNADLWNNYDLVPRAWGTDSLILLPGLYALSLEYRVAELAQLSAQVIAGAGVSELFAQTGGVPGHLNTSSVPGNFVTSLLPIDCFAYQYQPPGSRVGEYLTKPQARVRGIAESDLQSITINQQIGYQHIQAYLQYILPDWAPPLRVAVLKPAQVVRRMAAAV
jgi:hypothetical protein